MPPLKKRHLLFFNLTFSFLSSFLRLIKEPSGLDPEKVLMLAVLQDAVTCFQENIAATCKRKRALYQEAEEWFDRRGQILPFLV